MTPEKIQMYRDLEYHFTNKLHRWCRDCDQICQAAEIESGETIILVLLKVTVRSLQAAMSKSEFMKLMSEGYDTAAAENVETKSGRQL
jgi:hypothetical protein